MRLIDTSALIVAVNRSDDRHGVTRAFMERVLSDGSSNFIAPASIIGFVRQITRVVGGLPGLPVSEAFELVDDWLRRSTVHIPTPDALHFSRVRELLEGAGASGKLVDDAHLAALAMQYRATIVTFDSDFARFPGIKWESPGT